MHLSPSVTASFGIDALVTEGFEVEIWAVDEIFQPRSDRIEPSADGIRHLSLRTDAELVDAVGGLTDGDVVVAMCGMLVGQEAQFARLRDLLLASRARVAQGQVRADESFDGAAPGLHRRCRRPRWRRCASPSQTPEPGLGVDRAGSRGDRSVSARCRHSREGPSHLGLRCRAP